MRSLYRERDFLSPPEWFVGGDREQWTERRTEIVTGVVTCCLSKRSSRILGNSCAYSASNRYRRRESRLPEEGTMPPAKCRKLKAEVWMSDDDCNPNDRSRSWVIRLSKKKEKSIVNGKNGEKAPLSLLKITLTFKDNRIKNNAYSNSSKWKIQHT